MSVDRTPPSIVVWVCPECGYWRQFGTTGIHTPYDERGPGEKHALVKASYIFESQE